MKKWFITFLFLPSALAFADMRPASPFILMSTTSNWTAGQRMKWIEVSSCTGCGSGSSGGNSATLQSPATGPYNLGGVGAVINSTGVYLTSGSISIGMDPASALLDINSPDGSFIPMEISTPGGSRIFEVGNSSITVSTATFLVQSTASYGVPLTVAIGGLSGDRPSAGAVVSMFGARGPTTPKIVIRDHQSNTELELGAGSNIGLVGTFTNTPLQFRVGDAVNWTMDTAGNFIIGTTLSPGRLLVGSGTASPGGSKFQVFDGSGSFSGVSAGLAVGTTFFNVTSQGTVEIGTAPRMNSITQRYLMIASTAGGPERNYTMSVSTYGYLNLASSMNVHVLSGCGATPAIYGGGNAFTLIPGAAAGGCTVTFAQPFMNVPIPFVSQRALSVVNSLSYTISNTALTLTQTAIGTIDVILAGGD